MDSLLDATSLALAAAGLLALAGSVRLLPHWRLGLAIALELWTAAGLMRLAGEPSWKRIATVASIVAIRRLATARKSGVGTCACRPRR